MSTSFDSKVNRALRWLASGKGRDTAELYASRDFYDECEESVVTQARSEALKWFDAAREVLAKSIGSPDRISAQGDASMPPWLTAEVAAFWSHGVRQFVLFLLREDKETPFVLCLYGYDPEASPHRLLREYQSEKEGSEIYYRMSLEEKVRLVEGAETPKRMLFVIYQYARAFPAAALVDAIERNIFRDYGDTTEGVLRSIQQMREELLRFGDGMPFSGEEFEFLENQDEAGLIAILDSKISSPALWTRAAMKLFATPTAALLAAVERNRDHRYDARLIGSIDSLLNHARRTNDRA